MDLLVITKIVPQTDIGMGTDVPSVVVQNFGLLYARTDSKLKYLTDWTAIRYLRCLP